MATEIDREALSPGFNVHHVISVFDKVSKSSQQLAVTVLNSFANSEAVQDPQRPEVIIRIPFPAEFHLEEGSGAINIIDTLLKQIEAAGFAAEPNADGQHQFRVEFSSPQQATQFKNTSKKLAETLQSRLQNTQTESRPSNHVEANRLNHLSLYDRKRILTHDKNQTSVRVLRGWIASEPTFTKDGTAYLEAEVPFLSLDISPNEIVKKFSNHGIPFAMKCFYVADDKTYHYQLIINRTHSDHEDIREIKETILTPYLNNLRHEFITHSSGSSLHAPH